MSHSVEILQGPNWRIFRNSAEALAEKVAGKLAERKHI
jgi:hypothetical protein